MQGAHRNWRGMALPADWTAAGCPVIPDIPCIFPCSREFQTETGWLETGSTANQSGQERNVLCFSEIVAMLRQVSARKFPVSVLL